MRGLAIYVDILSCGIDRWNNVWGDPILSGTIIMVSYAVVALLMLWVAQRSTGRERWFWRLCGLLFVFQVINTHLDLHAMPGAIGHCLAKAQGWYEQRGTFKLAVLAGLAGFAMLVLLVMLIVFRRNIAGNLLLASGVGIIVGFTATKFIGHKGAEQLYLVPVGQFLVADVIELSGIAIAMLAALWRRMAAV